MATCTACGTAYVDRGSISVEQVDPVPDAP